jgi:hypothetical protein
MSDNKGKGSVVGQIVVAVVIALLVGGTAPWWWEEVFAFNPAPPPPTLPTARPTATPVVCFMAGTVVDEDDNQPLSNVQISYARFTEDANDYIHNMRSKLATTDVTGKFEADCSWIEKENFPLRLELSRSGWCSTLQTNEYVRPGEGRASIHLFVSDKRLKTIGCG